MPDIKRINRKLGTNDTTTLLYNVGYGPWNVSQLKQYHERNDTVYFDEVAHFDSLGRRLNNNIDNNNKNYGLFLGCSVAYAHGCNDDSTLPQYFQYNTSNTNTYNYAFPGWGPNNSLALLQNKNLAYEIKEDTGSAFYVFVWAQMGRLIGDMASYNLWCKGYPYYYLDQNELKRNKNFIHGRFIKSLVYDILWRSSIIKFFDVKFPKSINQDHLKLLGEVFYEMKKEYSKQFQNDNFYIIIYPTVLKHIEKENQEDLLKILDDLGIQYFDYSKKVKTNSQNVYKYDGHPKPHMHEKLAKILVEDLKLNSIIGL